jgi:hypothetical protein
MLINSNKLNLAIALLKRSIVAAFLVGAFVYALGIRPQNCRYVKTAQSSFSELAG